MEDWKRVATVVRDRSRELGLTLAELAAAAGVSRPTVLHLTSGRGYTRLPPSIGAIEDALGFEEGSLRRVARGAEPVVRGGTTQPGTVMRRATLGGHVRDGLMEVFPDVTVSQIWEAEARVMEILKKAGLLPPDDDTDAN